MMKPSHLIETALLHGAAGVLRRPVEEEALKQFLDSLTPPGGRA